MGSFRKRLTDDLIAFIGRQPMFFTASAAATGRVNVSPKGLDTFRVFDPATVGYLDLIGSGNETAAHVASDGRLTLMFNSFDAEPLILRLYGRGEIVRPDSAAWPIWSPAFPSIEGQRQIVLLRIESIQTSCGFGVPRMTLDADRPTLVAWAKRKGSAALAEYERKKNATSIDGLTTPSAFPSS